MASDDLQSERIRAEVLEALRSWMNHTYTDERGLTDARVAQFERMRDWVRKASPEGPAISQKIDMPDLQMALDLGTKGAE